MKRRLFSGPASYRCTRIGLNQRSFCLEYSTKSAISSSSPSVGLVSSESFVSKSFPREWRTAPSSHRYTYTLSLTHTSNITGKSYRNNKIPPPISRGIIPPHLRSYATFASSDSKETEEVPKIKAETVNEASRSFAQYDKVYSRSGPSWVDRYAPESTRPYLRLMRIDKPIGTWLLLWPGFWAIAMASPSIAMQAPLLLTFAVGSLVMRGSIF